MSKIIVIGAGQAGFSLVESLRKQGHTGAITLIGEEPAPPYQRPPLSKAYLLGDMAVERLFLRPESFYSDHDIELLTGVRVNAINPASKTVTLSNGGEMVYDKLALTTGSRSNRLPASIGGDLAGVHVVRSLADTDAMEPEFRAGARVLIIGGGYIGLEAAAVASKMGLKVTLVEMADRILQRVAAKQTSDYFRALHARHGVDIREGVGLERLNGDLRVTSANLSDGSTLEVDFVIAGVGVQPDIALAKTAGLTIENGIKTNAQCQTSDTNIFAAGDCASFPRQGRQIRMESVGNAIDQAQIAATAMLGGDTEYLPKPWFWSDQFDVKLQIAGLNTGYDTIITRGAGREVSFWYYQGKKLLAVDAMNDPRSYMIGKRLIEAGKSPDADVIADATSDLKPLLRG
ncbi:MAG: FAD-dependent oxidoreductase [Rhodobacteraceae bacterium]|nr:FAD-dependent oxidoreductase [Paracoccaceae bacterium]